MYKGYKVTKRLQRYIGYAEVKYQKLSITYDVNLWDVLESYDLIKEQPDCMKWYVYDVVKGDELHEKKYRVKKSVNGCTYVREVFEEVSLRKKD